MSGVYHRPAREITAVPGAAEPTLSAGQATATASGFRTLQSDFHDSETQQHEDVRLAAEKRRQATLAQQVLAECRLMSYAFCGAAGIKDCHGEANVAFR